MKVLFVCNGNVARSQEAEAFFNDMSEDNIAASCGINVKVGKPIDPLVVEVMTEADYEMKKAVRKLINKEMVDNADLIVSFKPENELPEFLQNSVKIRFWQVNDPQHQDIGFHRRVRDEIKEKVISLISELEG